MDRIYLEGTQYVRLANGAAEALAPYLGAKPSLIGELVLELTVWPRAIRPTPRRARDGRLIAGDPVLLDVDDSGLLLSGDTSATGAVLVPWDAVRVLDVLPRIRQSLGA